MVALDTNAFEPSLLYPPPLNPPPPLPGGKCHLGPKSTGNTGHQERQRNFLQGAEGAKADLHCDPKVRFCGAGCPPPAPKGGEPSLCDRPPPDKRGGGCKGRRAGGGGSPRVHPPRHRMHRMQYIYAILPCIPMPGHVYPSSQRICMTMGV